MWLKNLISLMGFGLIIGLIYATYKWQSQSFDDIRRSGLRTQCIVESFGSKIIGKYTVDDSTYSFRRSQPFSGIQDGEIFEISYMEEEPWKTAMNYDRPIIVDSSNYAKTQSLNVKLHGFGQESFHFSYKVGKKEYSRNQKLSIGKGPSEKKTYNVLYSLSNPRIAYLVLD